MDLKKKAPVSPTETSRGQKKVSTKLIPLPFESVKQLCPQSARAVQDGMTCRLADEGWPWDAKTSLMVDALQIQQEAA